MTFHRYAAILLAIAIASISILTSPANARVQFEGDYKEGEFVIQLRSAYRADQNRDLERKLGAEVLSQVRPDLILVKTTHREKIEQTLERLNSVPEVLIAEPNYIYRAIRSPNDPEYKRLWGLRNTGDLDAEGLKGLRGIDVGAKKAWAMTTGNKHTVIAVIDTGIDFSHPDLVKNAWVNTRERNGVAGVDDDGNGFVDDIHGWDFVTNSGIMIDPFEHGTHCAGTIAADGNNHIGVVGVAWRASLMSVRFLNDGGSGTLVDAVRAIDYSVMMKAKISSNSWGGSQNSEILRQAIERARDAGQLFVAAAGNAARNNDLRPYYPAGFQLDNIISVAAVNNRGDLASFSNWGAKSVHVAAPGVNILSTTPGGKYTFYSGTSMATPHVTGVASLLWAKYPSLSYKKIKKRLIKSSRPVNSLIGKVRSNGIVNAYYALSGKSPPPDRNDPSIWPHSIDQSVSTPHPYPNDFNQTYTVTVPGAKRIAVRFAKFSTEARFDQVTFFNSSGERLGEMSGEQSGKFSPIADGDSITLIFKTDRSRDGYGFDVDKAFFEH